MNTLHAVLGAGPLGRATSAALSRRGLTSCLVSRSAPAPLEPLPRGSRHQPLDLLDTPALAALLRGCSTAYFCAQPPYHRWQQAFPALLDAVLRACEQAGCSLVIADNLYGYGVPRPGTMLAEDSPVQPTSRKGRVRASMAQTALEAHAQGRVRLALVRASDFFGPGVRASALGERVWSRLVEGKSVPFSGDPDQLHSYAYIDDFADALVHLGVQGSGWGQVWHAPHQPASSTRKLLQRAAERHGLRAPSIRIEGRVALAVAGLFIPAAREVIEMLSQFECRYVVDDSRWRSLQSAAVTPIEQALDATVRWHLQSTSKPAAVL